MERAYNLILVNTPNGYYALLGLENGLVWNLLGGQRERGDPTRYVTAARELYEESVGLIDKRFDDDYWCSLSSYEYGKHKVFIHGTLNIDINQLNHAAQAVSNNRDIAREFKEMHRFQFIKLIDLCNLTNCQLARGQHVMCTHPHEKHMIVDGWLIYTLKNANKSALEKYL